LGYEQPWHVALRLESEHGYAVTVVLDGDLGGPLGIAEQLDVGAAVLEVCQY
jgi:hypothetical protein